jgi:hypothetical protein
MEFLPRAEDPQEFFDGAPVCGGCNAVTDHAWLPEHFHVRNRHASVMTYDVAVLVTRRFVDAVWSVPGVVFDVVPGDPEYHRMLVEPVVTVDRTVGKFEVGETCAECGRFSLHGWPVRFMNLDDPPTGFVRTDVEYGGIRNSGRCHQLARLFVDSNLAAALAKENLCRFSPLRPGA